MILDGVLVAVFRLGLPGAAAATAISQIVGGLVPVVYFRRENDSLLRLTRARFDGKAMIRAVANGSSEFVTSISMSLVGMLYNYQLIRYAGEDGVAAYGVLMYLTMVFLAIFFGYSSGTAPVVGFHYGAGDAGELRSLLRKSLRIIAVTSLAMFAAGEGLARPLSSLFVGYDPGLRDLTFRAFRIYSFSFLFVGIPIYGGSFFTALNDGLTSATISFLRTVVFEVIAVLTLPLIWGIDGVWIATVVTEVVDSALTVFFWIVKRKRYGY